MQKFVKLFISCSLALLMLCGCGKAQAPTAQNGTATPDNWVSVILITINPEIKLFLDADNNILAAEYLNNDAKTAYSGLALSGKPLNDGLSEIVATAISKEYLKPDADITVEVAETTGDSQSKAQIISLSQTAITNALNENSFSAHVVVKSPDASPVEQPISSPNQDITDSEKTCEHCNGTGKCPECQGGTIPCPACKGSGYEECTNCDASGMQKCPNSHLCKDGKCECQNCHGAKTFVCNNCNGSGKEKSDGKTVCHICNGSGIQNCLICSGKGYEICPHCKGAGKIKCEICKGTHKWECSHCHGAKTAMDCPECSGSFKCHDCGGTGIITQ